MISSSEEGVMFLTGENMAIGLVLKALIATHPNPTALRTMVNDLQAQGEIALKKSPPPNIQLFRFEQTLEQFAAEIKD